MLAFIPSPPTDRIMLGPLPVHFYGILIALGTLLAVYVTRRRYAARGGDADLADQTTLVAAGAGFLGARLAYLATHLGAFTSRPWAVLFIWEGGLALFGGLTLGTLAGWLWLHRRQGDVLAFADSAAPALPLAQAIGRWGNYFNQELYGAPSRLPWALRIDQATA